MESNCTHTNSLAMMSRAENLTPCSHFLGFASVCMQSEPVFSHVHEAQPGFLRGELRICLCGSCSPQHQSLETPCTTKLFLLWFLPKQSGKAGRWGSSILISPISALCFEVKWFLTATKSAPSSPFHQLPYSLYHCSHGDVTEKKNVCPCQPTVTEFYFKINLLALLVWNSLPYSVRHITHLKHL